MTVSASPVVKWVGGKGQLLPELLERMPASFERYFEPFLGGAALFFRVAPARAVLGDANPDLINLYQVLSEDVETVIGMLEEHKAAHAADPATHYYEMRSRWNTTSDLLDPGRVLTPVERAAAFVYLNKTCFNGLWRVNRAGKMNVAMGSYTDPPICVPEALRAASSALGLATLRCGDYRTTVSGAGAGDFVYFDSPYDGTFTSYTAGDFGPLQQGQLARLAAELRDRGAHVMLSNNDTPRVRDLYQGWNIDEVERSGTMNSDPEGRDKVGEVIITARSSW